MYGTKFCCLTNSCLVPFLRGRWTLPSSPCKQQPFTLCNLLCHKQVVVIKNYKQYYFFSQACQNLRQSALFQDPKILKLLPNISEELFSRRRRPTGSFQQSNIFWFIINTAADYQGQYEPLSTSRKELHSQSNTNCGLSAIHLHLLIYLFYQA